MRKHVRKPTVSKATLDSLKEFSWETIVAQVVHSTYGIFEASLVLFETACLLNCKLHMYIKFNSMDVSGNLQLKQALTRQFSDFYADEIINERVPVDLRFNKIKPMHAEWLVKAFQSLKKGYNQGMGVDRDFRCVLIPELTKFTRTSTRNVRVHVIGN